MERIGESHRDSVTKPKVAELARPFAQRTSQNVVLISLGSNAEEWSTPTGLRPYPSRRNPDGVGITFWGITQGGLASSATLGWRAQSRWDSNSTPDSPIGRYRQPVDAPCDVAHTGIPLSSEFSSHKPEPLCAPSILQIRSATTKSIMAT